MREGRTVTMGRYSRKQSACAGKESAEDFGKRREDQREISAHLQLNYANTPPCGCAGVTFLFSLIHPLYKSLFASYYLDYPVQLDYANTSPFRCVGGYFFTLSYSSIVQIFIGFLLSGLPLSTRLCKSPRADAWGVLYAFFLLPQEYFIYFFTSIIRRLLGISDHINCPKQFSSVNALPYRV